MIEAEIDCVNKYSIDKGADKKACKNIWVMKISGKTTKKHPFRHYHLLGCIGVNNALTIIKVLQFEKPDNNMRGIFIILI